MSRDDIPAPLQRRVRDRAGNRCEYCRISQAGQEATFHIDHVHPRRDGGVTSLENLALACVSCSLRKGARIEATDPESGQPTALFHPRKHTWGEHFLAEPEAVYVGRTPIGRATIALLKMNRPVAVEIRREEAMRGRRP